MITQKVSAAVLAGIQFNNESVEVFVQLGIHSCFLPLTSVTGADGHYTVTFGPVGEQYHCGRDDSLEISTSKPLYRLEVTQYRPSIKKMAYLVNRAFVASDDAVAVNLIRTEIPIERYDWGIGRLSEGQWVKVANGVPQVD